jgi:predicted HTH transcriptional regulator
MAKESQNTEWKRAWRDEYLKWICGFANADGGVLVIGRNDRGEAVGVADAAKLLEDIPNKVRDILGIMVDVNLLLERGEELLEIRVESYPSPVNYKGEYFYRSGSTNQMLKGAALDRFLLRKHGQTWDGSPLPGLSPIDLDSGALKTFRRLALKSQRLPETILEEPDQFLLEKLRLVQGRFLTNAAALLFHPEPERFVGGAYLKIGYFESNADLHYQDEVYGGLIAQVNQTIEILKAKYLRAWISYEGVQRTKDVANIFFRAGMIESWGRGIERIIEACREAGTPEPEAVCESTGLWMTFRFLPEHQGATEKKASQQVSQERLGERLGEKLGENRRAIISGMINDPNISVVVLAKRLGISRTAVENNIKWLKEKGYIKRIGPAKGGHWQVLP